MTQSVAEVLSHAADLLSEPGKWTQGGAGRDGLGRLVRAENINLAVCYCGVGAIWKAVDRPFDEVRDFVIYECFPVANKAIGWVNGFGNWNDHPDRTQAEVVAALRTASNIARSQGDE